MSTPADLTSAIVAAWEEDEDETSAEAVEPDATSPEEEESEDEAVPAEEVEEVEEADEEEDASEEPEEEAPEEEEEESETEPETPSGDEEEEVSASVSDDPAIQGFLSRHGGSVESALRDAVRMESTVGRQGRELGQLKQRNQELEEALEQQAAFSTGPGYLNEEQRAWIDNAVTSESPLAYVQDAVNAGEFDLARAVLDQVEVPPQQVFRVTQAIDAAEARAWQAQQPEAAPLDHQTLFAVIQEHYPDLPTYAQEMTATLNALGQDHPLAALARSQNPEEAIQGIIGLYEIARAKSATVAEAREDVKRKSKRAAASARQNAQVSSGSATPPQAQVARQRQIMPGLTLEALEAEFTTE